MLATNPSDLEAFIQAEMASGKYASADEAVSEAVRLLQERERHLERRGATVMESLRQGRALR